MAVLVNTAAASQADYISNEATPGFAFRNTGTGPGLRVFGLVNTSTATLDVTTFTGAVRSAATEGVPLIVDRGTVVSSPTVALLALDLASGASSAVFELRSQGFVSATTILFTTGATSGTGAIRVKYGDNYGWIPVLPSGSVTAAARA